MSGTHPPPSQDATDARVAAFHRLGLPSTARGPVFAHLVAVLRQLTGAANVTLALVDDRYAWCTAGVAPVAPVELTDSPAARALERDELIWRSAWEGTARSSHPALATMATPVTVTTVRVAAPDGTPIGALELAFAADQEPGSLAPAVLARFGEQVGELLELHAEVDEYRRFVELAPDPMVVLDREGDIVRVNPAMTALLSMAESELLGVAFLELVDTSDWVRVTAAMTRALIAPRRTTRIELSLRGASGTSIPCSVSVGHLGGALRHVQLVVHDLTERLRVEDEHSRLSEQLARAETLDAVGAVAAGVAHDLNNLLVVMLSNLSLAEESMTAVADDPAPGTVEVLREDLAEMRIAIDRATLMTGEMLALEAIVGVDDVPTDVAEVVGTVAGLLGRGLPEEVSLALDVEPGLPLIAADEVQLERALLNLVLNAVDAVGERGSVVVRAWLGDVRHVEESDEGASGRLSGDVEYTVELQVEDDGVGMSQSTLARAKEPLFTTKGEAGNGMGLATVSAFADAVGAQLRIGSREGEGTTVSLSLPASSRSSVYAAADVPVAGERVLLVDPGERTRRVIARMLSAEGYRVTAVGTLKDARATLDAEAVALVVTELTLPDGTGDRLVALTAEVRPEARVVVLAGTDGPARLGDVPVLTKPFSHSRLLRTVEAVLRGD